MVSQRPCSCYAGLNPLDLAPCPPRNYMGYIEFREFANNLNLTDCEINKIAVKCNIGNETTTSTTKPTQFTDSIDTSVSPAMSVSPGTNGGAIAGVVVAVLLVLVMLFVIVILFRKRRRYSVRGEKRVHVPAMLVRLIRPLQRKQQVQNPLYGVSTHDESIEKGTHGQHQQQNDITNNHVIGVNDTGRQYIDSTGRPDKATDTDTVISVALIQNIYANMPDTPTDKDMMLNDSERQSSCNTNTPNAAPDNVHVESESEMKIIATTTIDSDTSNDNATSDTSNDNATSDKSNDNATSETSNDNATLGNDTEIQSIDTINNPDAANDKVLVDMVQKYTELVPLIDQTLPEDSDTEIPYIDTTDKPDTTTDNNMY